MEMKMNHGCPFCGAGIQEIDYKDTKTLSRYVTENGKIIPGRMSGLCRFHQAALTKAIKRARNVALMPFVDND